MTKQRTVILALGAAASLLFAPFLVGALKGKAQEDNAMMDGKAQGDNADAACPCASAGKKKECKYGESKGSCGGKA